MKKLLAKRTEGGSNYISFMVIMPCIIAIVLVLVLILGMVIRVNEVERVQRQYLLAMERTGYMTNEMRDAFIDDLQELGAANISLVGTSFAPVGYGNEIHLSMEFDLSLISLSFDQKISGERKEVTYHVKNTLDGTALY